MYIFEKCTAFFGSFALLYTITETFILPLTPTPDQSFLRSLLDLALPFMIAYILIFYIIFGTSVLHTEGCQRSLTCAHRMHLQCFRRTLVVRLFCSLHQTKPLTNTKASPTANSTRTGGIQHHGMSFLANGISPFIASFYDTSTCRRSRRLECRGQLQCSSHSS